METVWRDMIGRCCLFGCSGLFFPCLVFVVHSRRLAGNTAAVGTLMCCAMLWVSGCMDHEKRKRNKRDGCSYFVLFLVLCFFALFFLLICFAFLFYPFVSSGRASLFFSFFCIFAVRCRVCLARRRREQIPKTRDRGTMEIHCFINEKHGSETWKWCL